MTKHHVIAAIAAFALSTSGAIAAQQGDGAKPGGDRPKAERKGGGDSNPGQAMQRLGQLITYVESKEDDKDQAAKWAEFESKLKEKRPEEFAKLDTDSDGHISRAEAKAAIEKAQENLKKEHPEIFAKIDTNNDGKLSRDELRAARERQKDKAGENGAGKGPDGDKPKDDMPDTGGGF